MREPGEDHLNTSTMFTLFPEQAEPCCSPCRFQALQLPDPVIGDDASEAVQLVAEALKAGIQ